MTLVLVVRHAIAEPHGAREDDDDRRLTPRGAKKMAAAVRGLKRLELKPDVVLSSPLPRATETAEILVEQLDLGVEIEVLPSLAPGHAPDAVYRTLKTHEDAACLAVVGHEPSLGQLVSFLLTGSPTAARVELKKGAVCAIDLEDLRGRRPKGTLRWAMTPRQLRKLGK